MSLKYEPDPAAVPSQHWDTVFLVKPPDPGQQLNAQC